MMHGQNHIKFIEPYIMQSSPASCYILFLKYPSQWMQ